MQAQISPGDWEAESARLANGSFLPRWQGIGFVTGYRRPTARDTVFLWQVGLRPAAQGRGLGRRLVHAFLAAPGCRDAAYLETTVTPSNEASRALFRAVARDFDTECRVGPCFLASQFPQGGHEDEELFRIGPLPPRNGG